MKKIKCGNENCDGTFGHLLSGKSIDIMRQKQQFVITGSDFTIYGTCGKCGQKSTFTVRNGVFDESGVVFKEDTPPPTPEPTPPAPQETPQPVA